jgi:DNA polymerase-3 subunit delta
MLHILYGEDKNNLAYELHRLMQSHKTTSIRHVYFDNNYQQIIDDVCQLDLFNNDELFIVHDATFLLNNKPIDLQLTEELSQLTQEIYFIVSSKKESFNKHTTNMKIKKIAKFTSTSKRSLINNILKSQSIKFENIDLQSTFENLVANDPFMVESELNKIILLADNKVITKSMLDQAINDSTELNIFKLTNYLLTNNKTALISLYDNLIALKHQPIELMQIMATQLFNLKILKQAMVKRYSQSEIETQLKINKFVQYANRDILNKITIDKINQVINELALLDYNIKHSLVNPYLGLKIMLSK